MATPLPYDYQTAALANLAKERRGGASKCLVIMAPALGKTMIAAFDVRNFEAEISSPVRVLYLAHQATILAQAADKFAEVLDPGKSFGRYDGASKVKDTDLVFATFQSVSEHLAEFNPAEFDYVIFDEAHHSPAETRSEVLDHFRPRFLLGLTATPYRMDGLDVFAFYDDRVAYNLPLEMALAKRLLPQITYRVFTDRANPERLSGAFSGGGLKNVFEPRQDEEIVRIIHDESGRFFEEEKTVIFCASIKQVHHFEGLIENCVAVTGEEKSEEQLRRIAAFRAGEYSVLLARDVLNEGIDMPEVNTIVFLRNTASPVVFIQQLGRGLRTRTDKTRVLVLDFVANIDRIRFLYAFRSKLELALRAEVHPAKDDVEWSVFEFDQTGRDVISELLTRKVKTRAISPVRYLLNHFLSFELSPVTIGNMVGKGRLAPDYEFSLSPGERYFLEKSSVPRFLRLLSDERITRELFSETEFARRVGTTTAELRRRERQGAFCPTWIHKRLDSKKITFWYDDTDLLLAKKLSW